MNFEHCCVLIIRNKHLLKNKERTLIYLHYHWDLLLWKRNKLKLGAIAFVVKEYKFDEVLLWEDVEIKFIRQDTTIEDYLKLENVLKRLGWQWDFKNYIALAVVVLGLAITTFNALRNFYFKYFPAMAVRSEHYDFILKCGFEAAYSYNSISFFYDFAKLNYWLIELLSDFCIYFNIIF